MRKDIRQGAFGGQMPNVDELICAMKIEHADILHARRDDGVGRIARET
jgi:hypothetical protein